ncbi:MAG: hypothetical protein AAGC85_08390 [Bacteroidota bacterium]
MKQNGSYQHYTELLLGGFLLLYLLFPTQNSTIDAWAYAAEIKQGGQLFHPHHLLFNGFHYLLARLLPFSISILAWLKVVNAIAAYFSLRILTGILRITLPLEKDVFSWCLLVGSSFAVMRFATEGETYMIPILFSLAASYAYLKYTIQQNLLLFILAGALCALACLFHQIQVGWLIGLSLGAIILQPKKGWVILLPSFLIPAVYLLIWISLDSAETFFQFINRDFYSGTASFSVGIHNFLLTGINFIRSFMQVHGIIPFFLRQSPWAYGSIVGMLIICIWTLRKGLPISRSAFPSPYRNFKLIHLGIFLIQLFLAFLSAGNAEFMVMLPFLLAIWLPACLHLKTSLLIGIGSMLLLWNITFGLIPPAFHDYYHHHQISSFIKQHPEEYYVLKDKNLVANQLYYEEGSPFEEVLNLISSDRLSPEDWEMLIQKAKEEGKYIYTDVLDKPQLYSRGSMLLNSQASLRNCELEVMLPIKAYLGEYALYRIKLCPPPRESD